MRKLRDLGLPLASIVALTAFALAFGTATSDVHADDENLAHAAHKQPGNAVVTVPLADGVRHVGGDNTSTGGHVVVDFPPTGKRTTATSPTRGGSGSLRAAPA